MNILIFSHYSEVSGENSRARRLDSLRDEFRKLGHKVHFLYVDLHKKITASERSEISSKWDSFHHVPCKLTKAKRGTIQGLKQDDFPFQDDVGARAEEICRDLCPELVISTFGYSNKLFDYVQENTYRVIDLYGAELAGAKQLGSQLRKADIILFNDQGHKGLIDKVFSNTVLQVESASSGGLNPAGRKALTDAFRGEGAIGSLSGSDFEVRLQRHAKSSVVMMVTHARFWQPGWGSHVRIGQLVKELSKHYTLVVYFTVNLTEADHAGIEALDLSFEYDWVREKVVWDRTSSEEVVLGKIADPVVRDSFAKSVAKYKPDVCLFEYLRFTYLTGVLPASVVKIIDTHDLVSRRQESRTRYEKATLITRKAEIEALSKYDFVIAIQRTEAAIVETWLRRLNVMYVPVCYDEITLSDTRLAETAPSEINVGFIGGGSEANVSAVKWFLSSVWPYFTGSNLKLLVAGDVGQNIKEEVKNVTVLGRADLEEFYRSVHFIINPVQWGGGMKIKTVEAMSYGLPVVSTSEGAAGLEEASDRGLLITDAPEEFAYLMGELAKNAESRVRHGEEARRYVRSEFDRDIVFRDLHSVIQMASPRAVQV